jgi:hypothetical protein
MDFQAGSRRQPTLEPGIMQKFALGLSALLLIAAAITSSVAQNAKPADTISEAQAGPAHANAAQLQTRARPASARAALTRSSRVARDKAVAAPLAWKENPSLMDSSWRLWPSLTDF